MGNTRIGGHGTFERGRMAAKRLRTVLEYLLGADDSGPCDSVFLVALKLTLLLRRLGRLYETKGTTRFSQLNVE
jgi:hypothetical protein